MLYLRRLQYFDIEPVVVFGPVTEKKTESNLNPFITEDPTETIKRGDFYKVPWIIGTAENEGNLRASRKYYFSLKYCCSHRSF